MSVPSSSYARNLNVVKMYFKKPMALFISLLSLLALVLEFMVNSKSNPIVVAAVTEYLQSLGIQITVEASNNILNYLLTGICIACFFMIYFFSATPNGNPSIFFTVLHILSVIELIFFAIVSIIIVVFGLISILSVDTVITFAVNNIEGLESLQNNSEQLARDIQALKPTLFLTLGIIIVILAIVLIYVNAQTAFLKSCKRSCKEPSLFTNGAKTFGNISMIYAMIQLVFVVIAYLSFSSGDSSSESFNIDISSFSTIMLAYAICTAIATFLKGSFAKNWEKFAKENEDYVYTASAAASRAPEANPIATFNATTRRSNDAVKQSQPYLYGEEQNNDPNKKSSYIPEELQNDYPQQYDQPQQGGMMGDPFMGDPFAQPMQPMGGDPYMNDPFAQSPMGNPYGQRPMDPNGGNPYNNGMM